MQRVVAVLSKSSCSVLVSRSSMKQPEAARDTQVVDIEIFLCSVCVCVFFCSNTKFLCCCFEIVSSVVFGVFTCAHVQYTIEECSMTGLNQLLKRILAFCKILQRINAINKISKNINKIFSGWESTH
jgi:hypothetical protein